MYVGFELNDYQPLCDVSSGEIMRFEAQETGRFEELSSYLIKVVEDKDVIDAEEIARNLFPPQGTHVFLSHSHRDKAQAMALAVSLEKKGIKVFVDSCVWGHFESLLVSLNKIYADSVVDGITTTYDYKKATELTASVHMMLAGALQDMIDRSELFMFLNTDNSIPLDSYEGFDRTYSPWIYAELQFSAFARSKAPIRITMESIEEKKRPIRAIAKSGAILAYKAFNDHLPKVDGVEFKRWYKESTETGTDALDSFYEFSKVPKDFREMREDRERILEY
ncbi:hypothetical protein [Pseudomonas brassicacearum]|uniref:hypothetical protein n=1 Tax=Pseudomonas brassicacearum TaxID=930166 RepID=UPI003ECDC358